MSRAADTSRANSADLANSRLRRTNVAGRNGVAEESNDESLDVVAECLAAI
jgi:hypothetical protein